MRKPDDERPTDAIDVPPHDEPSKTDDRVRQGQDVGGYVIDGELGYGGMGVVYAATHPLIGKRAAIKVLRSELSRDPQAVERFVNEARAVNAIGHPNIVDIFAFGKLPDGRSYYVMDLLAGESLRARIKRGPIHISEAASILDETVSALTAMHAAGIIHRDLKPDNIFMASAPGRWPEVKLLDFGLAKLGKRLATQMRTLTGSVMGTPAYMSPEQARASDQVDHRTDLYSLGVVAYELLAGVVPFKKQSSIDTLLAHAEDPVPSLLERVPTLPVELVQLVEALLAKEPEERPTLAAVRTVIKRLKGTKIPTMTAAGLLMAPITTTFTTPSDPDLDMSLGGPTTIDDVEEVMTQPNLRARPDIGKPTRPVAAQPETAPDEPVTARQRPLAPSGANELPTARTPKLDDELPDEGPTARRGRYSAEDEPPTKRRPPTEQPAVGRAPTRPPVEQPVVGRAPTRPPVENPGARGTPGPEPRGTPGPDRRPLQPGAMSTLAGHSMPAASVPGMPVSNASSPSMPSMPAGSIPPRAASAPGFPYPMGPGGFPSAAGLLPPEPPPPPLVPQRQNRWLVIAIVAVIASAVGIVIALLT